MAGLVKLKSHEGVGCDVTPEGGNEEDLGGEVGEVTQRRNA